MAHLDRPRLSGNRSVEVADRPSLRRYGELGVEVEHDFRPTYRLLRRKSKTLQMPHAALANVRELYLATNPDRKGEAIAWHLVQALRPTCPIRRVAFQASSPRNRDMGSPSQLSEAGGGGRLPPRGQAI